MQTFLPYAEFRESMAVLDDRRLGKQRVEAMQILNALRGGKGWANHPATLMWRGYEHALSYYMDCAIREWVGRGRNNTMQLSNVKPPTKKQRPYWLGDEAFHASHRSNLLRKDPNYYGQFGWAEPDTLDYVWPKPRS